MFFIRTIAFYFVTARKRSLRRLCFYTCLSVHRRGVVSQHALQVSSRVYPSMPCGFPGPHPGGSLRVWLGGLQAHTGGGEVEESGLGGLQAHTGGGSWGVWPGGSPGPHPGGSPGPHLGGVSQHALRQTPRLMATAAGGTHPTGMHSCFISRFVYSNSGWNILKFKDLSLPLFAQQLDFLLHQQ